VTERALLAKWRDALRDSDLDTTAKTVGYTIATYWNGRGLSAFPSKTTIAAGAGLHSVRAADRAVLRLERAGFLDVSRSRGRRSNTYTATLPTPHGGTGSTPYGGAGLNGSNPVFDDSQPRTSVHSTPSPGTGESVKAKAELNALRASRVETKKQRADARDYKAYDEAGL
jgi:hypothetical protein